MQCMISDDVLSVYVISLARVLNIFKESLSTCQIIAFFTSYQRIGLRKQCVDESKPGIISKIYDC